eukprot:COSAG01_NODE_33557_length_562_cov_0.892009_1_plen_177_part_10
MRLPVGSTHQGKRIEQRRQAALQQSIAYTNNTIEKAINRGNAVLFDDIASFIDSSGQHRQLPTALVLTGLNVADHDHSFACLAKVLGSAGAVKTTAARQRGPCVVRVSSSDASNLDHLMAAIIGGLIRQTGAHAQSIPSTLFLQRWYNSLPQAKRPTQLIILIQDVESIRSAIVQDM